MATRPLKTEIDEEAALSAVEEALKIDFGQEADADVTAQKDAVSKKEAQQIEAPTSPAAANAKKEKTEKKLEPSNRQPAVDNRPPVRPGKPIANDDRRSGAAALSARLSRKPSSGILYFAFLMTLAWTGFAFWAGIPDSGYRHRLADGLGKCSEPARAPLFSQPVSFCRSY